LKTIPTTFISTFAMNQIGILGQYPMQSLRLGLKNKI